MSIEFVRHRNNFESLDRTLPDPNVGDYVSDDFDVPPPLPIGYTYLYLKTILVRVLGRHVFQRLFNLNDHIDRDAIMLAFTIVLTYLHKSEGPMDLQSSLILNLVARRVNAMAAHQDQAYRHALTLLDHMVLPDEYRAYLKRVLVNRSILSSPWWTVVMCE